MLGDLILEERGKLTGMRVLSPGKVEVSQRTSGKILGIDETTNATYWSEIGPDGILYGEGQGLMVTGDGDVATWVGQGMGRMKPGGGVSYRGAIYFRTSAPKLARLNGMVSVFEYETDANDNTSSKAWQWK